MRDRASSHIHNQGNIKSLLSQALASVEPKDRPFITESVDFGREVGRSVCIETKEGDEIIFAQRQGRQELTRFVKGREPEPTSSITFGLLRDKEPGQNQYICLFAYMGPKSEVEPWDKNANDAARTFWSSHALVWGTEPVVEGTETKEEPVYFKKPVKKEGDK